MAAVGRNGRFRLRFLWRRIECFYVHFGIGRYLELGNGAAFGVCVHQILRWLDTLYTMAMPEMPA